jgi:hypothetical protein
VTAVSATDADAFSQQLELLIYLCDEVDDVERAGLGDRLRVTLSSGVVVVVVVETEE